MLSLFTKPLGSGFIIVAHQYRIWYEYVQEYKRKNNPMTVLFDIKTKIQSLNTSAKFAVRDDQSDFKVHSIKTLKKWNDVIFCQVCWTLWGVHKWRHAI